MNQRQDGGSEGTHRRLDPHGDDLAYVAIHRRLEADILTGRLAPGERLASERDLGARLGVARNTLRRALRLLAQQHLVTSAGRHGWVVATTALTERLDGPQGLTDWARRQGFAATSRVLRAGARAASEAEAERLRISVGDAVFEVSRVRLIDGVPLSIDRAVLHGRLASALDGVDFSNASLYATLRERADVIAARADVVLRAVAADRTSAELLEVAESAPLLEVAETAFDQYGGPFEASILLNRGDRYAYGASLAGDATAVPRITMERR
jgi:GntR family transcriptional regulator